jgi:hypothetical protein
MISKTDNSIFKVELTFLKESNPICMSSPAAGGPVQRILHLLIYNYLIDLERPLTSVGTIVCKIPIFVIL